MHLANSGFIWELWRQLLLLQHPKLLLLSAVLSAPILWPLFGLFMPVEEKWRYDAPSSRFGWSGDFTELLIVWLLAPLLMFLLRLGAALALYGVLAALVYTFLVYLLG